VNHSVPVGSRYRTLLRLRAGARVLSSGVGADIRILGWPQGELLTEATDVQRTMLARLSSGAHTREDLCAVVGPSDSSATAEADEFVARLDRAGWLAREVVESDRSLYRVLPVKPHARENSCHTRRWRLSRFAVLRPEGTSMVLECPSASAEIHVGDPSLVGLLGELGTGGGTADAGGWAPGQMFFEDLRRTGLLVPAAQYEDEERRFRHWNVYDLWFHSRSRLGSRGRLGAGFGATFWGRGSFPQPAVRPAARSGPAVELPIPDVDTLRATDVTLTTAVEDRVSIRLHDDGNPLSLGQLGEFLYRCARVRDVIDFRDTEILDLPYPAGGALGELELYLVVRVVNGLQPGLYHYDRHGHRLERCPARNGVVRQLVRDAAASAGGVPPPQILVVITARFARIMWKYEGMAYATILKHVGVLCQLMYLVATAMRLAPCALGAGNAELFSEAAGLDYFEESSVGEFLLGRPLPRDSSGGGHGDAVVPA
jgi:SagB-type dehydrogenase family enzyme